MRKILLIIGILTFAFLFSGCGKYNEKDLVKDLTKKIEKLNGYHLGGTLEIMSNENKYIYDVDVAYQKEDNFRVSLKNKTNNHEQIILKNKEGVYVLTPSLNKSFKFQSEWPYNNSQSYLLQTILKDIKSDPDLTFKTTEDGYTLTTKVNYSNNPDLVKQNIYISADKSIREVHVLNDKDQPLMKMKFNKYDLKATFNNDYFKLESNMQSSKIEENIDATSKIEDYIYPMYVPANTHLTGQNKVKTSNGDRLILTFEGEKPFILVEENATSSEEIEITPVFGELLQVNDTIGALAGTSLTWNSNGIDYYLVGNDLSEIELTKIANSLSVMPVGK